MVFKLHYNSDWLYRRSGIKCLFGHIFTYRTPEEFEVWLHSWAGQKRMNHERIHALQARTFKNGWVGYYWYYLKYWIKYSIELKSITKSRYYIPMEMEAYEHESDFDYSNIDWWKYVCV